MAAAKTAPKTADALILRIENREARIAVIGMGYVGLPLALAFAEAGFPVLGLDVDDAKVEALAAGRTYIRHVPAERIAAAFAGGNSEASSDFSKIAGADAVIICVPTPLGPANEPDLSFVSATAEAVVPHLHPGMLVVLESTTYPGTTREVVVPILERSGLISGDDLFVAYSPEREDPGNPDFGTRSIPKVVGGDGADARRIAEALYSRVVVETVPVSSLDVAEAVKLTENIFRSVNIALVNELKTVFAAMGIDIWEVIEAARTKPFGFMPFYPGPGLGGHCIPIDPYYLSWRARAFGQETRFIELAGEINTAMPERVVDILDKALTERTGHALEGSRVLLLGLAYKKNVDDTRESPGLTLIDLLEGRGAEVDYHDPFVLVVPPTRDHPDLAGRAAIPWEPARFGDYDAVLIATDHDGIDYAEVVANSRLVVDTRNATAGVTEGRENVVKA